MHIKWVDVPFSEGEKRTLAAVMTDNPPDLINLNPDFSALLAQKGTLEEIDEESVQDFNPEIINALKYNDLKLLPSLIIDFGNLIYLLLGLLVVNTID